jgi:hypothetical protein
MAEETSRAGRTGHQHWLTISAKAHDTPGGLIFETVTSGGTLLTLYVWCDGSGNIRVHTAEPTNQDSDGQALVFA